MKCTEQKKKTYYYTDPLTDDFYKSDRPPIVIDKNHKYLHNNPLWKFCSSVFYHIIAQPFAHFYMRVIFGAKFVNKKSVKKLKKQPYFIYGNHTGHIDAFIPNVISSPKRNFIVVSPDTLSIKGVKTIVQMLGAIPVASDVGGTKNFLKAIESHHRKHNITIYPEAHIWPYYTGVRPFKSTAFTYPVNANAPTFAFFTAYSKPKGFLSKLRKANVTVYVSDPIYPDPNLPKAQAKQDLRDKVYAFMKEKSVYSDYNVCEYVEVKK